MRSSGHGDAEKFWECVTVFFLVTMDHPEWKRLHEACANALEAMRPDAGDGRTLNPRAMRAVLGPLGP